MALAKERLKALECTHLRDVVSRLCDIRSPRGLWVDIHHSAQAVLDGTQQAKSTASTSALRSFQAVLPGSFLLYAKLPRLLPVLTVP